MSDTERPAPPWPLFRGGDAKVRGRRAAAAAGERSDSNESVCGGGGGARLASRPCRGPPPVWRVPKMGASCVRLGLRSGER